MVEQHVQYNMDNFYKVEWAVDACADKDRIICTSINCLLNFIYIGFLRWPHPSKMDNFSAKISKHFVLLVYYYHHYHYYYWYYFIIKITDGFLLLICGCPNTLDVAYSKSNEKLKNTYISHAIVCFSPVLQYSTCLDYSIQTRKSIWNFLNSTRQLWIYCNCYPR